MGPLEAHVDPYLTMGISTITFGLSEIFIPLTTNFICMAAFCFFMGLSQGILEMSKYIEIVKWSLY